MARYLLDTNIVIFMILGELDNFSPEVRYILEDYSNQLYMSSVSVAELLQLYRIKKVKPKNIKNASEIVENIENDFYIEILPFTKEHTRTLASLKIADGHNDPFDHSIISHAISEKMILVSSDRKFREYTPQNLNFAFNRR
ncbi:MAG: type II toxin-antitoxin system VapC family toxin [Bergeyella sp.]